MRSTRPHTRNMGYGEVTNATLRSKNQLLQQQPHAHRIVGCCCWAAGSWRGALCKAREMCVYPLAENPARIQFLRAYTEIGDAETQSPRRCCGNPGICLIHAKRPKKLRRLATRDTLHGSRPNLRQRDRMGRTVLTPSDVSGKGASTKR